MIKKIYTFLLLLFPITNIYGIGLMGISIGKLSLLLFTLFAILKGDLKSLSFPSRYLIFAIWMLIVPFFYILTSWVNIYDIIYKLIGVLGFVITVGVSLKMVNLNILLKYYEYIVYAVVFVFILQECLYWISGMSFSAIIPNMYLADGGSTNKYVYIQQHISRHTSLFLEPSHLAVYLSFYFVFSLVKSKANFFDKKFLFIVLIFIFIRSGNGYFILFVGLFTWVILHLKSYLCDFKKIFSVLIMFLAIFFLFNSTSDDFEDTIARTSEVSASGNSSSSGFIRMYKGYYIFSDLDLYSKLIGIGQGNLDSYSIKHKLYNLIMLKSNDDSLYLNGIQQILVYGGILGLILFLYFTFKYINKENNETILIVVFLAICIMSGQYNSDIMLLFIIVCESYYRKKYVSSSFSNGRTY